MRVPKFECELGKGGGCPLKNKAATANLAADMWEPATCNRQPATWSVGRQPAASTANLQLQPASQPTTFSQPAALAACSLKKLITVAVVGCWLLSMFQIPQVHGGCMGHWRRVRVMRTRHRLSRMMHTHALRAPVSAPAGSQGAYPPSPG